MAKQLLGKEVTAALNERIKEIIIQNRIAIIIPFAIPKTPPKILLSLPTILNENSLFKSLAANRTSIIATIRIITE